MVLRATRSLMRAGALGSALLAGVGLVAAPPSTARSRAPFGAESRDGGTHVNMGVGKSTIVTLPEDAAEIFVANPAVANAIVRTARQIYIIGTGAGQTSLFALDKQGREIASFEISIGRDIGELSQILHAAMPNAAIQVRTINDTIILTGGVDSAEDAQRAADMAKGFAKQISGGTEGLVINSLTIRGRDQVMLKVTISEMRRDIAKQLGISSSTWGALTQYNPFAISGALSSGSALFGDNSAAPTTSAVNINAANGLKATLQAFERYGVTRTLAEPTVTAVSGESAKFTVGGEFPYSTGLVCSGSSTGVGTSSTAACTTGAAFKPYGITLNFEPVVLSEGRILLHLATEVADLDFTHGAIVGGVSTPGLLTRKNETTIELPSGGSIATAGLLQQQSIQSINGLPGLLNLPILGALFRSRDYQRAETELMIIVTPIIVKPVAPNQIAKPDDGFTDASDPQAWLLGRMNRLYATPSNPEAAKNYRGHVGFIQD
jgi:pilus assembly protein CpaC